MPEQIVDHLHPLLGIIDDQQEAGALGLDDLAALSAAREETGRPAAAAAAKRMRRLGRQSRLEHVCANQIQNSHGAIFVVLSV